MLIDILIILFAISAIYRGRDIGFIRQLCSTVGFFGGLFLGAWLEKYTVQLAHTQSARSIITLLTTLGCALILLTAGEYLGIYLKRKVVLKRANIIDNGFGGLLSVVSLLLAIWLTAAVVSSLPFPGLQSALRGSRIVRGLDQALPSAPGVIGDLGHLIDPNGFPQVFIGTEPSPNGDVSIPSSSELQAAVIKDKASVVKIQGQGCGGIVEGSGFVVGSNLVATNAHVVAGIRHPYVQDSNGSHDGTVIWFDPKLDFAVLRVPNLAGHALVVSSHTASVGTPAAALGYPGGGGFKATPAAVSNQFTASGRDIYGNGNTDRSVYELQADIIPGNSGGPLVDRNGTVIGIIFAQSSTYQHVGYALTTDQANSEINQAAAQNQPVGTGRCAE